MVASMIVIESQKSKSETNFDSRISITNDDATMQRHFAFKVS
jgi:hypothetical protein